MQWGKDLRKRNVATHFYHKHFERSRRGLLYDQLRWVATCMFFNCISVSPSRCVLGCKFKFQFPNQGSHSQKTFTDVRLRWYEFEFFDQFRMCKTDFLYMTWCKLSTALTAKYFDHRDNEEQHTSYAHIIRITMFPVEWSRLYSNISLLKSNPPVSK